MYVSDTIDKTKPLILIGLTPALAQVKDKEISVNVNNQITLVPIRLFLVTYLEKKLLMH